MNERSLFLEALDRNPAERTAFLDEACRDDIELRQRVKALLHSHQDAGSFLGRPAIESSDSAAVTPGDATETCDPNAPSDPRVAGLDFLAPGQRPGSLGRLDHYEVLGVVGQGGMGIVLRAFDEKLHRVIALKVMAKDYTGSTAARRRFNREAKAAAAVVHDHIVPIHAVEESGPVPYLVMQFIEGKSLQQKINDEGSLELKEILRIGLQAARGLAAAHRQGLVHRDIKPANLLLENGVQRVKITDFGLARAVDDATVSQSGVVAGTPQYMSPEQADGQPVDHRSDLFSLGSVLYAMCAGRPPFRANSTVATLKRVCDDTPRPIRELNPDIPEWLCTIIARLHAKRPAERYQTAHEVADVLEKHLAQVQQPGAVTIAPTVASPVTAAAPPLPAAPSGAAWLVRAALAVLAVGGLVQLVFVAGMLTRGKIYGWAPLAAGTALAVLALVFAYSVVRSFAVALKHRPLWRWAGAALLTVALAGLTTCALWTDWFDGLQAMIPSGWFSPPKATGQLRIETADDSIFFEMDHYSAKKSQQNDRRVFEWTLPEGEHYVTFNKLTKGLHTGGFRPFNVKAGQTLHLEGVYLNGDWTFREMTADDFGWRPMFDVNTLGSWIKNASYPRNAGGIWSIQDGILQGKNTGEAASQLALDDLGPYPKGFRLRAEARISDGGFAAILFRWQRPKMNPSGGPEAYAAVINSNHPSPIRTGSLLHLGKDKAVQTRLVPPNVWFTYEIIAQGNRIELRVNGEKTAESVENGPLFSGASLGLEVDGATTLQVRKLELKTLEAEPALSLLHGRWDLVSAEYQGKAADLKQNPDQFPRVLVLSEGQYGLFWGKQRHEGTLTLDASKTPAEMNFSGSIFDALRPRKAIYEMEGDRLKLCLPIVAPNADPPRPTGFMTSPESKNAVLVYERKG